MVQPGWIPDNCKFIVSDAEKVRTVFKDVVVLTQACRSVGPNLDAGSVEPSVIFVAAGKLRSLVSLCHACRKIDRAYHTGINLEGS